MAARPAVLLRPAVPSDVPSILRFIRALAGYERLSAEVTASEELLHEHLFGPRPAAEAVLAFLEGRGEPVGFALHFTSFSTFLARPGLYLEDLFVEESWRGQGVGQALLRHLARLAVSRGCARLEWNVLDWNEPALAFYRALGAQALDGWTVHRVTGPALQALAGASASGGQE